MSVEELRAKDEIETYLRGDTLLHLYELGDLDDFFWPFTTWYGLREDAALGAVALLYQGTELPVLLALGRGPRQESALATLIPAIRHLLPPRFYAHLSGDLAALLAPPYEPEPHGRHVKMALTDRARALAADSTAARRLTPADSAAAALLYRESYPGNWFDPRMIETGQYFGIWAGEALVSVAGVHVFSPRYRVAALGNVTTRPDRRREGLATAATAALVRSLLTAADDIGLNVAAGNVGAIACYERLGFAPFATYEEVLFELRGGRRGGGAPAGPIGAADRPAIV